MNSAHLFEFQSIISKLFWISIWSLNQSWRSFYVQELCLNEFIHLLNQFGVFEKNKNKNSDLSYSNPQRLFSSLSVPHCRRGHRHLLVPCRASNRLASLATSWTVLPSHPSLLDTLNGRHRLQVALCHRLSPEQRAEAIRPLLSLSVQLRLQAAPPSPCEAPWPAMSAWVHQSRPNAIISFTAGRSSAEPRFIMASTLQ